MGQSILDKTLNQLEGNKKTICPDFNSYPVQKSYELMDKKLRLFEPEDLRLMIGQKFGLKYLVPIAIVFLKKDPLVEANFYEGDLLLKVLKVDKSFWQEYPQYKEQLLSFFKENLINYDLIDDETKQDIYYAYEELTE